jgi:large conductance mechanosensitive channel
VASTSSADYAAKQTAVQHSGPETAREAIMGMLQEFKTFAMRGNVIDLAVGVVLGAAFGKVVSAFVEHVIMPVLALAVGSVDLSTLGVTLRAATADRPPLVLSYGGFLQAVFDFVLIAFAIFLLVKTINRLHRKPEPEPAAPAADVVLLTEIRDLLRARTL